MITVLIRCSDDYRVLDCIRSIRRTSPNSPIVVSMTPNKKLQKAVLKIKVNNCVVPKHNAAVTNNKGLELVKTKKVIVTDTDTVFEEEAIGLLDRALDKYDVVKPKLVFCLKTKPPYFSPIANLRTFFNDNEGKMYIPGVSFNLKIRKKIGGYFFDEKIPWGEDSDFSNRVKQNRLKTKVVKKALLYHPSVNVIHDLADAFLIGFKKQNDRPTTKSKAFFKRVQLLEELFRNYGLPTFLYGATWYLCFDVGKVLQKIKPFRNQLESFFWKILSKEKN